jgi:ATP-dependent helicase/nuclease subunit A
MANAGSGKTTALTARVVRLLLLGVPPERIVCITYTKAAASEMRARVLVRLRGLLLMDDTQCRAEIEKLTGEVATDATTTLARGLFSAVLDSPSGGLQLTTIHGFCQSILRRFPLEAGITPHFTVLEDGAAEAVIARAKQGVLQSISVDEWLAWAMEIIGSRGGEYRFESLANDIIKHRRLWQKICHLQSPEALRERIYALHEVTPALSHNQLTQMFCDSLSTADEAIIRMHLPELLAHETATYRNVGEGLAHWLALDAQGRLDGIEDCLDIFLTEKGTVRARLLNDKEHPAGSKLRGAVERMAEQALRYASRVAALACAEETSVTAILAKNVLMHYAAAKAAIHALDYDDLIEHTLTLFSHPDTIGWVMTKLDHRIDHVLIDEAQDNSADVWELARILVEELFTSSDGIGSANQPRSLLVVGDEKQSIYSFQGAAPEQFDRYRSTFKQLLSDAPSTLEERTLTDSWRSTQAVLTLVDTVCAQENIKHALSAQATITAHQRKREKVTDVGQVVLYPPLIQPESEKAEPLVMPLSYRPSITHAQQRAEQIAATIAHWLKVEKRLLFSQNRPIHAGDILILVHKRAPLVPPLIRALQRYEIAVAGLDRLTLADHLAVSDVLALMQWCANTSDDLALAQVLRSPIIGITDEALRALAYGRSGTLWQQCDHPLLLQALGWRSLTPYDFLTHLLEVAGCRRAFARRFGAEVHEVLDELKAQAAAMPEGMGNTLAEFHAWLSGSNRQIKREQETGASDQIRIMTVHGAKGLEAPVVILTDTSQPPDTGKERLFTVMSDDDQELPVLSFSKKRRSADRLVEAKAAKQNKLLAEYHRLLYVALTRARDELHVFGTATKKGELKTHSWYASVAEAMRLLGAIEEVDSLVLRDVMPTQTEPTSEPARELPLPLPHWANTAPISSESTIRSLAPSRMEQGQAKPYAATLSRGARERGVRIHRVLELLDAKSDTALIARLVRHIAADWPEDEQQAVISMVEKLHTQEHWIWRNPHWPEVNVTGRIANAGAAIPFGAQIDMLVKTPDGMVIIDYKTGSHVPKQASEVSANYLLQLKIYRALIAQIYPQMPIRCAIIWTNTAQLMWLDEAVAAMSFPDNEAMKKASSAA